MVHVNWDILCESNANIWENHVLCVNGGKPGKPAVGLVLELSVYWHNMELYSFIYTYVYIYIHIIIV